MPSPLPDARRSFIETASGKLASRPQLERALLSANRTGDQLVVTKLDRLGRSLEHLIELSRKLQGRNVDLVVLDQGSTPRPRSAGCSFRSSARSPSSSTR
jgi:DNA invertase Pin-like site-specific DNA recombinase